MTSPPVIRHRLRLALLTGLACACLSASGAAPAHATEAGINAVGTWGGPAAEQASTLGVGWVRSFVRWDQIEPAGPGRWDAGQISAIDDLVDTARARNVKVLVVVLGAPSWANGSSDAFVPPRDPSDFGRFLGAMAARYKGRIAAWEIWNEPDDAQFWHGHVSAAAYAPLLRSAHHSIKDADPAALVLAAASTGNDYPFLEDLYAAGAGESFDGVASHTDTACLITSPDVYYRENGRVGRFSFLGFRETHAVLASHGHGDRPIFLTEIGWSATRLPCERGASAGKKAAGVSEAQQAAYLRLAYRCLSFYPYVRAALWFSARDVSAHDSELGRYGLMRWDGSHRPAWDALASVARNGPGAGDCGDFTAPQVSVHSPSAGAMYDRSLKIRVAARDEQSKLGRITLYAGGHKIRSFTDGLRNDEPVEIEWMGARNLPYGPVDVTVEALDEFGNTTRRAIPVTRVDPAAMPPRAARVSLRLSGRGLVRTVRGRVSAPGAALQPKGKVVISWQYRRRGRWVTLHKRSKNAGRSFRYKQLLRNKGRWRVVADYRGAAPFKRSRTALRSFRARPAARVALRLTGRGRVRAVRGRVSSPYSKRQPRGRVVISWQHRRGGRWVTRYKRSSKVGRGFRHSQRLRTKGRWRVVARYRGGAPFRPARKALPSFRAR